MTTDELKLTQISASLGTNALRQVNSHFLLIANTRSTGMVSFSLAMPKAKS
jgi:hypothetical protein